MSEDAMEVARNALDMAKDAKYRIDSHEDICAVRYKQLETSIGDVKKIITWAGTTGFALIMAALVYFIEGQFDANEQMRRTIQDLQQQQSRYEQQR